MKQHRQAMLRLHLSDQQFHCLLRCTHIRGLTVSKPFNVLYDVISTVMRHWLWEYFILTHWGRVTHICVGNITTNGSDNGLSPDRRQAIIWTNARILSIWSLVTNFSEILTGFQIFSFQKMYLQISPAKLYTLRLGPNLLKHQSSCSGLT